MTPTLTPADLRPGMTLAHPRLGTATVAATTGSMTRLVLASGRDYFAHPEDLRAWRVKEKP